MSGTPPNQKRPLLHGRRSLTVGLCLAAGLALTACGGGQFGNFGNFGGSAAPQPPPAPEAAIGTGQVRVGLILPLSAQGNAGVAAQSMKNAAELALNEFKNPNIQLLVKDDGGTPQGAQAGAQAAISEGAQIILGSACSRSRCARSPRSRARAIFR